MKILEDAGAIFLPNACGICAGYGTDRLASGIKCISSTLITVILSDPLTDGYLPIKVGYPAGLIDCNSLIRTRLSSGVFPKPIPGSIMIFSGWTPAERALWTLFSKALRTSLLISL